MTIQELYEWACSKGVCHKSIGDMLGFVEHGTTFPMRNVKSKKDCKWYKGADHEQAN